MNSAEYDRMIDHLRTSPFLDERMWRLYQNAIIQRVKRCFPLTQPPDLNGPMAHSKVVQPIWLLGEPEDPIHIQASVERKGDCLYWYHVSFKRQEDRTPSAEDVRRVREAMFRRSSVVVQVFPPRSEYVNLHAHVLHLWERLGGDRLIPDLREPGRVLDKEI